MKNTPYIYLAQLCLILIMTIGVLFGRNDEQEVIDFIEQEEKHHEDSLNKETLKDLDLGSPRGQDVSNTKQLLIDTLFPKRDKLFKHFESLKKISREDAVDHPAIEVSNQHLSIDEEQKVSIYTQVSNWLGRIFMLLSGLLIVLGGVYLLGQRKKDQESQPKEITNTTATAEDLLAQNAQKASSKSNAYERFMKNLKKDFAAGDIDKVIRQLLVLTKGTNTHDMVGMLAKQWEELETEHLAGRITEDFYKADVENIGKTIEELIDELEV